MPGRTRNPFAALQAIHKRWHEQMKGISNEKDCHPDASLPAVGLLDLSTLGSLAPGEAVATTIAILNSVVNTSMGRFFFATASPPGVGVRTKTPPACGFTGS